MWFRRSTPGIDRRVVILWDGERYSFSEARAATGLFRWTTIGELRRIDQRAIAFVWENDNGEIEVIKLNSISIPKQVIHHAISALLGLGVSDSPEVWGEIPSSLIAKLISVFDDLNNDIRTEWLVRNEDALTGSFFRSQSRLSAQGWIVEFGSVEFSGRSKEPKTGADVALIIKATDHNGRSSIKTLWLQAKRTSNPFKPLNEYNDLSNQMRDMRMINPESYALLFSGEGALVPLDDQNIRNIPFSRFIGSALRCNHGTRDRDVLINSIDRKNVFGIEIYAP